MWARAAISKATFYAYFPGKERLCEALRAEGVASHPLVTTDNRSAVLESALRLFGEKGYHATTLEAVAEAAGVTKGTVDSYFKSKESLFGVVIKRY